MKRELFTDLRSGRGKEKNDLLITLFCCICLLFLGYLLYLPALRIGLDNDDRGLVEVLFKLRWNEFVFMNDGSRFRPVCQLMIYLFWRLCGSNAITFIQLMPVLNTLLGVTLFLTADYLFRNRILSFAISAIYLASRFAYYQILMLLGVMEGTALFFALTALLFALDFIINKRNRSIWFVFLFYILAIYTHERYLTLVAVALAAIWLRSYKNDKDALSIKKRIIYSLIALGICGLSFLGRIILFNGNAYTGTGGQDMRTTFSLQTVISYVMTQILYLLGWGSPETYLSGYSYHQVGGTVKAATVLFDAGIAALVILYIIAYRKKQNDERQKNLQGIALITVFIGACIIASSTTIRVEMRWIYVSQAALLLGLCFMIVFIVRTLSGKMRIIAIALSAVTLLCSFYVETAYRQGWKNQYYYKGLEEDNSLTKVIGQYSHIPKRDLIIIDQEHPDEDEEVARLLRIIDAKHQYRPKSVTYYKSIYEYQGKQEPKDIVIEKKNGLYRDLTGIFDLSEIQKVISGVRYEDGWATNDIEIEVTPYRTGKYQIVFFTNDDISRYSEEERTVHIAINGEDYAEFVYENQYSLDCELEVNKPNSIKIRSGFTSPNTGREGNELAYTVHINQK